MIHYNDNEATVRSMLVEKYKDSYGERITEQVDILLSLNGYVDSFNYLQSVLANRIDNLHSSILISGYAAGSEMLVARKFGFQEIYGVEVDPSLYELQKLGSLVFLGCFLLCMTV